MIGALLREAALLLLLALAATVLQFVAHGCCTYTLRSLAYPAALVLHSSALLQRGASPGGGGSRGGGNQGALLGVPLLWEELLRDSFLRQLTTRFLATLHEERGRVAPELAQQAQRVGGLVHAALGWGVGVVTELGGGAGSEEDEDAPVVVEEGEAWF